MSITSYTWTKVVERMALKSDLPHLTTHTMRHLRLTDLARAGLDMHHIAALAGHRVLQSTLIFIHLSGARSYRGSCQNHGQPGLGSLPPPAWKRRSDARSARECVYLGAVRCELL